MFTPVSCCFSLLISEADVISTADPNKYTSLCLQLQYLCHLCNFMKFVKDPTLLHYIITASLIFIINCDKNALGNL